MEVENHMVLEEYKVEGESQKEMFRCYVERNASLKEKLEMFFEHWQPLEFHKPFDKDGYHSALASYDVDYVKYLIKSSGVNLDIEEALEIYEEIMK